MLVLNGVDTYTGGTNIGGGTVQLGNSSALGTGPVNIYSPGVLDLAGLSFSTSALSGNSGSTINSSVAGASLTTNIPVANTSTFSGVIANGGGTMSLTKSGAGVLVLNGGDTYTGGTNIGGGTLQVGNRPPWAAVGSTSTPGPLT